MVQVIEQQDIFGNIGKAFSQGFGESLKSEVDRARLSTGIQSITDKMKLSPDQGGYKTMYETIPELIRATYGHPEYIPYLSQSLQQMMLSKQGQAEAGRPATQEQPTAGPGSLSIGGAQPTGMVQPRGAAQPISEQAQQPQGLTQSQFNDIYKAHTGQDTHTNNYISSLTKGFTPFGTEMQGAQPDYIPSATEMRNMGAELNRLYPAVYPTVDSGTQEIQRRVNQDQAVKNELRASTQRFQQLGETVNSAVDKSIGEHIPQSVTSGGGSTAARASLGDAYIDKIKAETRDKVRKGTPIDEAAMQAGIRVGDLEKKRLDLIKAHYDAPFIGGLIGKGIPGKEKKLQDLDTLLKARREPFVKEGDVGLDIYEKTLKTEMQHSPGFSSLYARPLPVYMEKKIVSASKNIEKRPPIKQFGLTDRDLLTESPEALTGAYLSRRGQVAAYKKEAVPRETIRAMKEIVPKIDDSVGLPGLMYYIKGNGLDDSIAIDYLKQEKDAGNLKLNARQEKELSELTPITSIPMDDLTMLIKRPGEKITKKNALLIENITKQLGEENNRSPWPELQ